MHSPDGIQRSPCCGSRFEFMPEPSQCVINCLNVPPICSKVWWWFIRVNKNIQDRWYSENPQKTAVHAVEYRKKIILENLLSTKMRFGEQNKLWRWWYEFWLHTWLNINKVYQICRLCYWTWGLRRFFVPSPRFMLQTHLQLCCWFTVLIHRILDFSVKLSKNY